MKNNIDALVLPQEKYFAKLLEIADSFSKMNGITCYISVNKIYSALMDDFKEAGIDTSKFIFIDAVTRSINPKTEQQKNCIFVNSPGDLTSLSIAVNQMLMIKKVENFIFDSLSTLLVYNKESIVYKFAHSLANKLKQSGKNAVFAISEGDSTSKILDEISVYIDNVNYAGKKEEIISNNEKERKKDLDLIYLISHEIRTPLTSIVSLLPLVLDEKIGKINEKQKETLNIAYFDARRLAMLIDNMVNASEIEKGDIINKIENFYLDEIVKDISNYLKFMFGLKEIKLKIDIQKNLMVKADKEKIKQSIINVVMNSLKYTKSKGEVSISAKKENYNVLIEIKDNGEGMNREEMDKLFIHPDVVIKKYLPNDNNKKALSGMGYGTYIAKKIVDAHKGKIWAESKLGFGTSVFILFPIQQNA